jgi:hypothetical protein
VVCYLISRRSDPIAIVRTSRLAEQIVRCRPRGYYTIKELTMAAGSPSAPKRLAIQRAAGAFSNTVFRQPKASASETPRKLKSKKSCRLR